MRNRSLASAVATAVAVAGLATFSGIASAESDFSTSGSANAQVDFRVTIPSVLFLRVGSGAFLADDGTTNEIEFDVTPAELVSGGAVAGTGGDLGGGAVTVQVFSNGGAVDLTATNSAVLTSGSDTISWSEIEVTVANGNIPHPTFVDAGTSVPVALAPTAGRVTNRSDTWSYGYRNSSEVASGTYTGTVTYTVVNP